MPVDPLCNTGDMLHERRLSKNKVIRREHGHGSLRISPGNPVSGQQHAGSRASVLRLGQDLRSLTIVERIGHVASVAAHRDDNGLLRGNAEGNSIKSLLQKRAGFQERHILLWPVLSAHEANERPQSDTLAAGKDDGPQSSVRL